MNKYILSFEDAEKFDSEILGGKGKSLAQMQSWGVTVPPGFIITTNAGKEFAEKDFQESKDFDAELKNCITVLEEKAAKAVGQPLKFGDAKYPLLVSVRSGAPISMPGQMSTLLNIGLSDLAINNKYYGSDLTIELYWRLYRTAASAFGIERTLIQNIEEKYLSAAKVEHPAELNIQDLRKLITDIKSLLKEKFGKQFVSQFEDPEKQLQMSIKAVWESWNTPTMISYRRSLGVGKDMWTAVVVQMMVLGNKNTRSGSGVVYSRDILTGKDTDPLPGSFLFKAQGEDVVSGEAKGNADLAGLKLADEKTYSLLRHNVALLEKNYKAPLDIEFTIEDGNLWMLQARTAPLSDKGLIQFVVDLVDGHSPESAGQDSPGLMDQIKKLFRGQTNKPDGWRINKREAVERIRPSLMERLYLPVFSKDAKEKALSDGLLLAKGIPASPGVAVGKIAVTFDQANEYTKNHQNFIWVRDALDPKEHQTMRNSVGVISIRSSVGSHGAIIANVLKKPCVVCCDGLDEVNENEKYIKVNGEKIYESEGKEIAVDAITGEIFMGEISTVAAESFDALKKFEEWWDVYDGTKENTDPIAPFDGRPHSPWGNGTHPQKYDVVDNYRQQVREFLARKNWNTEKAQVVEAMNLIPDEMRIKQVVVNAADKDTLANALRDVFNERRPDGTPAYWNGPRTALGPGAEGAAPWQMGMNRDEQIDEFLTQRNFKGVEKAKSGGYPRWMNPDPTDPWKSAPVQIIVMYDPAEKGVEQFEAEHFVCNVSCRSNPDQVMVDINLGTAQLRSFEKISPDILIRLTMELNSAIPDFRGRKLIQFGKKHWNLENIKELPSYKNIDNEKLEDTIDEKMSSGELSSEELTQLVGERNFKVAKYVESQVFGEWWVNHQLPYRMRALDEVFSLQVLEIQGRADATGDVKWFLVYDAKGRDEKSTVADQKA